MLKLRSCPKCKNGDITLDRDYYGWYEYCIQCGYMRDLEGIVEVKREAWNGSGRKGKVRVRIVRKGR